MKIFALILVIASFLAGSVLSVLDPRQVEWSFMAPALMVGVIGLWIHRKVQREESRAGHRLVGNIEILDKSLFSILANLEALCQRGDDLPVYDARFEIDRLFREDLNDFAEARGESALAQVMSLVLLGDYSSFYLAMLNRVDPTHIDAINFIKQYLTRSNIPGD